MLPGKHEELKTDGFNLGYKKAGNITEPLLSKIKVMSYNYVELYSEMGSLSRTIGQHVQLYLDLSRFNTLLRAYDNDKSSI